MKLDVRLRGRPLRVGIMFSAASSYLLFGYDQGVLGGLVAQPSFLDAIGNPNDSFIGLIVALYNIGCMAGCLVAGMYGYRLGRKVCIILGCLIVVVGGTIQAATYGSTQLIVGRIVTGVGTGLITSTVPVYVSECSPAMRRGRNIAIQMSTVIFGTVVAYWLDYGTIKHLTGEVVWRFPIAFQNVFALFTAVTLPFLPETPRWLYSNSQREKSLEVLSRLLDCESDDPRIIEAETAMEDALRLEREEPKISVKDLFHDKSSLKNPRRLVLCFMVQFWQQFTGINVIAFYVTIVLETNVGLTKSTSSLVAGFVQIAFWLGTFPPMWMLDRVGRRKMLIGGSAALLLCMSIFTACIAVSRDVTAMVALVFLCLYEISFGMSWNSIPWLYAPEITPLRLRHLGSAIATFSEWLWTFVIALITPYAINNAGWKFYLTFIVMIFLNMLFTFFFFPETCGKTLEEIDFIFDKRPWDNETGAKVGRDHSQAQTGQKDESSSQQHVETELVVRSEHD